MSSHVSGPGYYRWVSERTHAWLNRVRRLLSRWEKKSEHYLALLHVACAWITFRAAALFGEALSRIDTRADPPSRTVRVQAEFPYPDGRVRAGMFLSVELIFRQWEGVLVAEQAVISEGISFATVLTLFVIPVLYALLARFTRLAGVIAQKLTRLEAEERSKGEMEV